MTDYIWLCCAVPKSVVETNREPFVVSYLKHNSVGVSFAVYNCKVTLKLSEALCLSH